MLDKIFPKKSAMEQEAEERARLERLEAKLFRLEELEERVRRLERLLASRDEDRGKGEKGPAPESEKSDIVEAQAAGPEAAIREELGARLREAEERTESLRAELQEAREALAARERQGLELRTRLEATGAELKAARNRAEIWRSLGLDEADGQRIAQIFARMEEPYRAAAARYYKLDDCLIFACQCGVVARMRQCWEGCRELALTGEPAGDTAAFLSLILELYNKAFPDNPCQLLTAEAGADFDYQSQDRLGAQGRTVQRMILPGFIMPNGAVGVKCLVELKQGG